MDLFDKNLKLSEIEIGKSIETFHDYIQSSSYKSKKLEKKYMWLSYFVGQYGLPYSFIEVFNDKIPIFFEKIIDKKVAWNKVWLSFAPDEGIDFFDFDTNYNLYQLNCEISNSNWKSIPIEIRWLVHKDLHDSFFYENNRHEELDFQVKCPIDLTQKDIDNIPTFIPNEKPKKLKYKLSFDVLTFLDDIPHEAILVFKFKNDDPKLDMLQFYLNEAQQIWNSKSKVARINSDAQNDHGLIHSIYLSNSDEGEYTFYLDHGSARGEIVKYLLDNLEGKDLGIKEVFIESV